MHKILTRLIGENIEAIRLCRDYRGRIDLLLTDVVMPETSGKEVAERLRELRPAARVLFMSGYTDEAIVRHGVLDAKVEFIQKPFTWARLGKKVRDVLDRHARVAEAPRGLSVFQSVHSSQSDLPE